MIPQDDASQLAGRLTDAAMRVAQDYAGEDVIDEESFTSQLCGRLKETIHAFETDRFVWQVDSTVAGRGLGRVSARSLGKTKEEPLLGADMVMVIEVSGSGVDLRKGFLAQAKRLEPGRKLSTADYEDLRSQCAKMLDASAASYVLLYHKAGVHVISANAVQASQIQDLWSIPTWPINTLFYDFAICWIGDRRLQTTSRRSLEDLRALTDTQAAVRIVGEAKSIDRRSTPRPRRRAQR